MEESIVNPEGTNRPQQVVMSPSTSLAILNSARDKVGTLFDKLDESDKGHYSSLAKQRGEDPVGFYTKRGERMPLTRLQLFIIMHLQELYNQEVANNYVMEDKKTFMRDFLGLVGHVHANPTMLAERIYGNPHPTGYQVTSIREALRQLSQDEEYKGMLLYDAYDLKKKKPIKLLMYDHPISCGLSSEALKGKRAVIDGVIQLHEAFVSFTNKKYIISVPLTKKISEFYEWKLPDLHSLIFVVLLQKTAGLGNFTFNIGITKLSEYLALKDVRKRQNCRFLPKIQRAIDCALGIGLLKKKPIKGSAKNGEILYTFHINEEYFPARKAKLIMEDKSSSSIEEKQDEFDFDNFLYFFNSQVEGTTIPSIKKFTTKRKEDILARLKEYGKEALYTVVQKATNSTFLNGRGYVGFDWLFRSENFLKVFEGNYDDRNVQPNNYGTGNNNGYRTAEDMRQGAVRIINGLSAAAQQPKTELPVV